MNTKQFWTIVSGTMFTAGVVLLGYALGELRALNNASKALTDVLTDEDPDTRIMCYDNVQSAYFTKGGTCINIVYKENED